MRYALMLCMATGIMCGCQKEEPPVSVHKDTGRPETRSLEAASVGGYDGKAIRQKVDAALDANDAQIKKMQQQSDQ